MPSNEETVKNFYQAFQKKDLAGIAECYHPDIFFSDPVFQNLKGEQVNGMWQMLVGRSKDMVMTYSNIQANDQTGSGNWEATYTFSQTGRKVHNVISSAFRFKDGKIIEHRDTFDLWKWSGMALGLRGTLLGWTPFVQNTIRANAIKALNYFLSKKKQG